MVSLKENRGGKVTQNDLHQIEGIYSSKEGTFYVNCRWNGGI
jgi:hypothetical protein